MPKTTVNERLAKLEESQKFTLSELREFKKTFREHNKMDEVRFDKIEEKIDQLHRDLHGSIRGINHEIQDLILTRVKPLEKFKTKVITAVSIVTGGITTVINYLFNRG